MTTQVIERVVPTVERVHALFNPRAIALIGATDRSLWSVFIYQNLLQYQYPGNIYLVNPKGGLVHGVESYSAIADLPDDVDLAFVMVGPGSVLDVFEKVAAKGIKSAVILTSGFGEIGEEGAKLERDMLQLAADNGILVLGPNGNGYINAARDITPYGLAISPPLIKGGVGIVLQSGALASQVLGQAQNRNVGISLLVSMGNETILSLTDVVRYLVQDPDTKVITLFIESIRQPEEFKRVALEALAAGKPVVAIKTGTSEVGAKAARAHTGSLVGDDAVVDAVFRQSGVIRVDSLEDLITTSGLLASTPPLRSARIGFVTPSGGACELIADRAEVVGLELPAFAPQTIEKLKEIVPDFASPQNPLDVTGYILIDPQLLNNALVAVGQDPNIDAVVAMTEPPKRSSGDFDADVARFARLTETVRALDKPVFLLAGTATDISEYGREVSDAAGLPYVLGGLYHGLTALGNLARWSRWYRDYQAGKGAPESDAGLIDLEVEPTGLWAEHVAAAFLAEHGVPVVPQLLVASADDAAAAADRVGYPVVLKVAADDLGHKSDIGGVVLNLADADAVRQAYDAVTAAGRKAGADVQGALVQPMRSGGVELIVGVVQDPAWGPVMAVGLGGIFVEILKDSKLLVLPTMRDRIREALTELRGAAVLKGARGSAAVDVDAVVDAIAAVGKLAVGLGDRLESLEINPLLASPNGAEALDALITWKTESQE